MAEVVEPKGRRAFVCSAKGCAAPDVPYRIFLPQGVTSKPSCPEHGATAMVRQPNRKPK